VRAVSPWTTVTAASGTSSSSATICAKAVLMPWPSSTFPLNSVTLPAPSILSQESTSFGEIAAPCVKAGETLKASRSAPLPFRKARR
jgi:hypothetical protein